jgi:RNA polymerase sigma factor (TIGR02999 family)
VGTSVDDVTRILLAIEEGDQQATDQLLPLVYDELRKLAAAKLKHEKAGQTLDATALVHEAYVRLVHPGNSSNWDGRNHFFVAAAEAMRRILVENARRKRRTRHGGQLERNDGIDMDDLAIAIEMPNEDLLALDEALDNLKQIDAQAAQVVTMHYFLGLPFSETAALLGISERTAYRNWSYARAWLYKQLTSQ